MVNPILELENIHKSYGRLEILRAVNFSIEEGMSVAIMGPSGVGKSTLLHIAGLMEAPTSGDVRYNQVPMQTLRDDERSAERLKTIGFLFQFHYLLPEFTALENVLIPARLGNDDLPAMRKEALHLLEQMGIEERMNHYPNQLSGGEQQRVALARALIRKPKLLLCDEPTGNLDPDAAATMMGLIWTAVKERGLATIIMTHNLALAKQAHRRLEIQKGRLIAVVEA